MFREIRCYDDYTDAVTASWWMLSLLGLHFILLGCFDCPVAPTPGAFDGVGAFKDRCYFIEGVDLMNALHELEGLNAEALHFRRLRWMPETGPTGMAT